MEEQILRLCKRLKNFTLEEIAVIAEKPESEIKQILALLVNKGEIEQNGKKFISVSGKKQKSGQANLPLFFQYHTKEVISTIVKGFSAEVDEYKIMFLTEKSFNIVSKFNKYFRRIIFEKQKEELLEHYSQKPKTPWEREFFEKRFFFYNYENKVFISESKLQSVFENKHSKDETAEFKRVYSFIKRYTSHNTRKYYPHFYISEAIWRRNKDFETLKKELCDLLRI